MNALGRGLLRNLMREMLEIAAAGHHARQDVTVPPTTLARWAEDIGIALHELPADVDRSRPGETETDETPKEPHP